MKRCGHCKIYQRLSEFGKDKHRKDGLHPTCKTCLREYTASRKEQKRLYDQKYNMANKEKKSKQKADYQQRNKEHLYAKRLERIADGRETLIEKISARLHSRLYKIVKNGVKSGSAVRDLGCSPEFLIQYLESQFLPGMAWSNYGKEIGKWHIDHIVPLSSFDLSDREQFLKANHYTNLQPLWAIDNLKKSKKVG
jgi:hypothetical protein